MKFTISFRVEEYEVELKFPYSIENKEEFNIAEGVEYAMLRLISYEQKLNNLKHYAKLYIGNSSVDDKYTSICKKIIATEWTTPFLMDDDLYNFYHTTIPF